MALIKADHSVLQFFQPQGVGTDPPSLTLRTVTLNIQGSEEAMTLPVYTNTKVREIKGILESRLGVDPSLITFTYRQGAHYRQNLDCEEVAKQVTIRGIKSFKREKHQWQYPHCVIGAGHIGLKLAMTWLMDGYTNFVVFDRRPEVGGTSWWEQANDTSRLQTEMGVYHLEYHETTRWPLWAPDNPWPSRQVLLDHFKETSEQFGILPYCRMNTNVTKVNVLGGKDYWNQSYEITIEKDYAESVMQVSSISMFPGNLTIPKRVIYKGEEQFEGDIVYGICNSFDYASCNNKKVVIVGSGAFAVENVRTCVEFAVKQIYMVCRRKTISMPRIVSWYINQSLMHVTAAMTLEAMTPMYDLIGYSQWGYYSIFSNEARTQVNIRQKSRFGIGDVYFLSMWYGLTEHIVDDIKRVSYHKVHLNNGRVLEDVEVMLKLLGFNGEFENDRLLKIKELYGWWVNKDFRRYIVAEPLGVDANNFGGTSFSPGAIMWAEQQAYLLNYPKDWANIMNSGQMPTHVADESIDRPAYVVEARHGSLTGIALSALAPGFAERMMVVGPLKSSRMRAIHPPERFLEQCKREWFEWGKMIHEIGRRDGVEGFQRPIPDYPYTLDTVYMYLQKEKEMLQQMERMAQRRAG